MKHSKQNSLIILMSLICLTSIATPSKAQSASRYNIIPYPASLRPAVGTFTINKFIECGGDYTLKLKYSIGAMAPVDIPAGWIKHK